MNIYEESTNLHKKKKGKLEIKSKVSLLNRKDLSLAYTPGVAQPCREIFKDISKVYDLTIKSNSVAVITDGSAVLGLGNIGAEASLPVMEGKAILLKEFGDVDAYPICIKSQDKEEIIATIKNIAPVFGGINLEDIAAPKCFEIEERLQDLGIPVMHDDQHGTAVVVLAALINSLKIVGKKINNIKIVINGAGAAGNAVAKMLLSLEDKPKDIIICDSKGIIYKGRGNLDKYKENLADMTNKKRIKGTLKDAIKSSDVFIGVSIANAADEDMVKSMNKDAIIFAMANPEPEIMPDKAKNAGAMIVGTGRSDFPNQINNVLAFPGIFRGALDSRASRITEKMKVNAAYALANYVKDLSDEKILPDVLDKKVAKAVAKAVYDSR